MPMIFRNKPIFIIAAIILLTTNCRLGASSDSNAYSEAFKNISAAAVKPDTTRISAINEPLINVVHTGSPTPLKNMFGVNGYEWNFLENPGSPNDRKHIYEDNYALIPLARLGITLTGTGLRA